MPAPTFAEQMVSTLQTRLLALAGVKETGGDGEKTILMDLKKELSFWEARVAREAGTKPRVSTIDLASD